MNVPVTPLSLPAKVNANGVCGPPLLINPYSGSGNVVSIKSTSTSTVGTIELGQSYCTHVRRLCAFANRKRVSRTCESGRGQEY